MSKENAIAMRQLARHYHALGFNVLPLGADKHPALVAYSSGTHSPYPWDKWQTTRQSDNQLADILKPAWWVDVTGIGGICGPVSGGLVCVDFDLPKGTRGDFPRKVVDRFLTLAGLPAGYDWTVRTPRGGWHIWVLCPDLALDKGKLDFAAAALPSGYHIELRFTGHYAALPGSTNVDGAYTWHAGHAPDGAPATVDPDRLLPAYDAVVDREKPTEQPAKGKTRRTSGTASAGHGGVSPRAAKAIAEETAKLSGTTEGGRNDRLNLAAFNLGQLVGAGDVDRATVEAALLDAARACGLDDAETRRTMQSGLDRGIADPREPAKVTGTASAAATVDGSDVTPADAAAILGGSDDDAPLLSECIEDDLAEWGYRFSMSELDDMLLCNGDPLSDAVAAQIRMTARDSGRYSGKGKIGLAALEDTYTALAHERRFHPVKDYLNALQWDGKDHFRALNAHFKDTHDPIKYAGGQRSTVFAAWLWRWMAGAVAKVFATGAVRAQTPVLVLAGGQGLGKSTFAAWLASPLPDLFLELPVNPDDKDHERLLASKWLWEVSEIGATTRRKDREALKAFFTKADCTFRKPYGRHPVRKPALASFIGTLNPEAGFLVDPTGNRRFLTVELASINHAYAQAVDVNQVWAQVVAAWRQAPAVWKLTPEEVAARDRLNKGQEIERPYEGQLVTLFEIDRNPENELWMSTAAIAAHLQKHGARFDETLHHGTLGATLRGMGLERKQRRMGNERVWGWRGLKPKPDDLAADAAAALGV